MIIAIVIVVLAGLFFIATNSKNKICWAISLCIFGVCTMLFTGVLYTSKFSYYVPQIRIDYYIYLAITNLKLTMTSLAWFSNIGITLVLVSYILFPFFLTPDKTKIKYFLLVLITFFFITNTPPFCYNAYLAIYSASTVERANFLKQVFKLIENINTSIFLVCICIPLITLFIYGKRTKIFFLKYDAWISILCMTLIDIFVLYVFVFGSFRNIIFHNMNLLRFPENTALVNYSFYTPALLLFVASILVFFITFYRPFRSLSVISEKQLLRNDKQLRKNLRMLLHTEKNMFFTIGLLAKQGLENEETRDSKLKAISEIAEQSTTNLSRALDLFRDSKMSFKKADLVKCINNALYKVYNPSCKVTIKTSYDSYSPLYINMDENHIHEVFTNLFRNSLEALKNTDSPTISVDVISAEGFAIIDITDNGCGIEKKNIRKIFSPLFSTKPSSTNWGIGLHYVSEVLRLHNGRIRVSSEPEKFTTFQVVIPLARESERRFLWKK